MADDVFGDDGTFSVGISEYEGIDVEQIASEEAFSAAVRTMNQWRENLDSGEGAAGTHGSYRERSSDSQYRNTGGTSNDITVEPQEEGSLEYTVGGDSIPLAVAETGRVPTPGRPPPFDPIADWAREKGLEPEEGQSFEEMVDGIRWAIAKRGIPGFQPGRLAAKQVGPTFEERVIERINEEIDGSGES